MRIMVVPKKRWYFLDCGKLLCSLRLFEKLLDTISLFYLYLSNAHYIKSHAKLMIKQIGRKSDCDHLFAYVVFVYKSGIIILSIFCPRKYTIHTHI